MYKILLTSLLYFSYSFGMEQHPLIPSISDSALIPTRSECAAELDKSKNSVWNTRTENADTQLLRAFAQHGAVDAFDHHDSMKSFNSNKLFDWAVDNSADDIVTILAHKGIVQALGSTRFEMHLNTALERGNDAIAVTLLKGRTGFKPEVAPSAHYTLLQRAALVSAYQFAKALLEGDYGVHVDETIQNEKATALKICAQSGQPRSRLRCNSRDDQNKNAMLCLLLRHGANHDIQVTTRYESGMHNSVSKYTTSFVNACMSNGYDDCLEELLKAKKIDPTLEVNSFVSRPLYLWAASEGKLPLIQAIMPADESAINYTIKVPTLIDWAQACKEKQIIDYLLAHKAVKLSTSTVQQLSVSAAFLGWTDTLQNIVDRYGMSAVLESGQKTTKPLTTKPLMAAGVGSGSESMVRQLIEYGCSVHEKAEYDQLPLPCAVQGKSEQIVGILLAEGAGTQEGITQALKQFFNGDKLLPENLNNVLAYVSDRALVQDVCIQCTDKTPVEYAATHATQSYRLLKIMLEAGFDPNDFQKVSPLQSALGRNCIDSVALLLQHGADPNVVLKGGETVLHLAAFRGSPEMLQLLYNAGITATKNNMCITPLAYAVYRNNVDEVGYIVDKDNFDVPEGIIYQQVATDEDPETSFTLFEFAIKERCNSSEILEYLYKRGANIERVNEQGETPIFLAVRCGWATALTFLVAQGARLDVVNHQGQTPLSLLKDMQGHAESLVCAVVKGMSQSAGGTVTLNDAFEHNSKYKLSTWIRPEDIITWKKSLRFDPFAKVRELCGIKDAPLQDGMQDLAKYIDTVEKLITQHGHYLLTQKMNDAFSKNDLETVQKFIAAHQDPATYTFDGDETLLHWAAQKGHAPLITELLTKPGFKEIIGKKSRFGRTVLGGAGTVECAQVLIDNGACITQDVLMQMASSKNLEVSIFIRDQLSVAHFAQLSDEDVQKLYHTARNYGNTAFVDMCIKNGAQITVQDLVSAVREQDVPLIQLLRSHGLSLVDANNAMKKPSYDSLTSCGAVAIKNKNLALLNEVLVTTNLNIVAQAASSGWHEGVKCLLEYGHRADITGCVDPLQSAIYAGSIPCIKLLAYHQPITLEHIKQSIDKPEILNELLPYVEIPKQRFESFITLALTKKSPQLLVHLLQCGCRVTDTYINNKTYLHAVAKNATLFGAREHGRKEHASWQERVKNIAWLTEWKKCVLEGNDFHPDIQLPSKEVQDVVACLHALMTTPLYQNAQEHKKVLYWMLQKSVAIQKKRYQAKSCNAYQYAKNRGNSSTFNDLLDPSKFEQWHAAIDKAYELKMNK